MEHNLRDLDNHPDYYVPFDRYKPSNLYAEHVKTFLPKSWRIKQDYFWTFVQSPRPEGIVQGWKIHLSALPNNVKEVLEIATRTCIKYQTEFKFASDSTILRKLLSKNCARSSAGKIITIYPGNIEKFENLLEELWSATKDIRGPYILSDRQYKDSDVVFYRYGGFHSFQEKSLFGKTKSLILNESFHFIEDRRQPRVIVPGFASDHHWGQELDEILAGGEPNIDLFNNRFEIEKPIKQSNAGGIYLAKDIVTSSQVIIKEARPHIGTDREGVDAISRLNKEYRLLLKLEGEKIAPAPYDWFVEWEHSFLAQELIVGQTLKQFSAQNMQTLFPGATNDIAAGWFKDVVQIGINLIDIFIKLERHGIVFGDVSMNNIMINADTLQLRLIDFEGATQIGIDTEVNIFTPGFAPRSRSNRRCATYRDDYFAVGCVLLSLVSPSAYVISANEKYHELLLENLKRDMLFPQAFCDCIEHLIDSNSINLQLCRDLLLSIKEVSISPLPAEAKLETENVSLIDANSILAYIEENTKLDAAPRIYPTGANLDSVFAVDYGAIGIARAFNAVQGEVPKALMNWIVSRFKIEGQLPGLLNGLSGAAWTFAEMGHLDLAKRALNGAETHRQLYESYCLGYGAAGFGMSCLKFWKTFGDPKSLDKACIIADILCDEAQQETNGSYWTNSKSDSSPAIGLHEGSSGIALFLLYVYCASGNTRYLECSKRALDFDLSYARNIKGYTGYPKFVTSEPTICYPYLAYGSAGIGSVLLRLAHISNENRYVSEIERIKSGISQKYTVTADIFTGLAGLGNYMLDAAEFLNDESYTNLAFRVSEGLQLFQLSREGRLTFPIPLGSKVDCSYGSGAAGIAMFLDRLHKRKNNFHFTLDELLKKP